MTHKELFENLIYDENISDNVDVQDGYEEDNFGNSIITISYEGKDFGKKKGFNAMLILLFNKKGRMVKMEMAICKKGTDKWQIAQSETFANFKQIITGVDQ